MQDMRNDHRKELGKCDLKYKNYPATRPACDFNITATHCHSRTADPEFSKITGCSSQTWRRDRTADLNRSVRIGDDTRQNNMTRQANVL